MTLEHPTTATASPLARVLAISRVRSTSLGAQLRPKRPSLQRLRRNTTDSILPTYNQYDECAIELLHKELHPFCPRSIHGRNMSAVQSVKNCVSTPPPSSQPDAKHTLRDNSREVWSIQGWGKTRRSLEQCFDYGDGDSNNSPKTLLRRELNYRPLTPPTSSTSRTPLLPHPLTSPPAVRIPTLLPRKELAGHERRKANTYKVRLRLPRHR